MNRPVSEPSSRLLLVEGPDDQHVIRHMWERQFGQPVPFQISPRNGIYRVIDAIRDEARVLGREALGVVVDANDSPDARWQSISDRLTSIGIQTPETPDPDGTIIEATDAMPRIGIWRMPDNKLPGELEDFVAEMIPDGDPVWPLSQRYIDGIPVVDRKFVPGKTLRAKIHAWLAARREPRQMGLAVGAGDLEIDGPLCTQFAAWLDRLFVSTEQL